MPAFPGRRPDASTRLPRTRNHIVRRSNPTQPLSCVPSRTSTLCGAADAETRLTLYGAANRESVSLTKVGGEAIPCVSPRSFCRCGLYGRPMKRSLCVAGIAALIALFLFALTCVGYGIKHQMDVDRAWCHSYGLEYDAWSNACLPPR